MVHVTILIDDIAKRFKAGEHGVLLVNDSEKYDYFVRLDGMQKLPKCFGGACVPRDFYFYKEEVEIVPE